MRQAGRVIGVLPAVVFVGLALVFCGLIFELAGYSAPALFHSILEGAFLRPGAWEQSLRWGLPLFVTATGVAISFRAGFFNIGAQGQFYVGAIAAAFVVDRSMGAPAGVVVPLGFAAAMVGGALWAAWPGFLRLRWGTDEVITTLMGNFIAALLLVYVTSGPLKDPSGSGQQASSPMLPAAYRISDSSGVSFTILAIAALVALGTWLLVNRTAFGLLAGLAGRNPVMARYQGAPEWRLGLSSFLVGGALAGLGGALELFGPTGRIATGFLPAHGFTAILIALVANLSVTAMAAVGLFFGGLASAALYLPILVGLPASAIDVINASIALFITARSGALKRLANRLRLPARRR